MAGLLISVRNAAEARIALENGADIIDVKEPAAGPLGQAPPEVIAAVLDVVAGRVPVSAAMGELRDWSNGTLPATKSGLTFVKAGLADAPADWRLRWRAIRDKVLPSQLVSAAYADWQRMAAPSPLAVCQSAIEDRAAVLLLDTGVKDGSSLLDWLTIGEVAEITRRCRTGCVSVALAGSLGPARMRELLVVEPDWFAVRGAACRAGKREGEIDATSIRRLKMLLQTPNDAD